MLEARLDAAADLLTPSSPIPVQRKRNACNTRTSLSLLRHFCPATPEWHTPPFVYDMSIEHLTTIFLCLCQTVREAVVWLRPSGCDAD